MKAGVSWSKSYLICMCVFLSACSKSSVFSFEKSDESSKKEIPLSKIPELSKLQENSKYKFDRPALDELKKSAKLSADEIRVLESI